MNIPKGKKKEGYLSVSLRVILYLCLVFENEL